MYLATIIFNAILVVVVQSAFVPIQCSVDLDVSKQHKKCRGKYICSERHPEYPQECIDRLLTEKYHLKLIQPDKGPAVPRDSEEFFNDIDCPKCDIHYGAIYQIIDSNDNLRVVVQSIHFNQTISTERCSKPGRLKRFIDTAHFTPLQMNNYYIYSEQIKLDYNFLVLSLDGTEIELAKSKEDVPVACTCRVR